jgi:cation transport regulator ChaB
MTGGIAMPYSANTDLPKPVQNALPAEAQSTWRAIFNSAYDQYKDDAKASATAWAGLKNAGWQKNATGAWVKVKKSDDSFELLVPIAKVDEDKHQVFGWAAVSHEWVKKADAEPELSQVVDRQKDLIDVEDLEKMAYRFTKMYRAGGEMHIKKGSAEMIESMVFTIEKQAALGIPAGLVPVGWWIGFEVTDERAWDGVKSGVYKAFSIEGSAKREEVKAGA